MYVSKDAAEGEEVLTITGLTGDTGHRVLEWGKWLPRNGGTCFAVSKRAGIGSPGLFGTAPPQKRSQGRYRNDDLAEMRSIFHRGEGFPGLSEGKNPIHYGTEAGLSDGAVHFQEMLARADVDAAYL